MGKDRRDLLQKVSDYLETSSNIVNDENQGLEYFILLESKISDLIQKGDMKKLPRYQQAYNHLSNQMKSTVYSDDDGLLKLAIEEYKQSKSL
ncbi:MAG: hypothetical protein ACOCXG_01870 [Nanoarchaeota archaeon]